jgi:prolipoprotein diacylglyceryltransferase
MLLDAERTIVVFVLAHNWIFKNQETNGAVKSLTDNNLEAILFIAKLVFVFTARHYFVVLFTKSSTQNLQG